MFGRGESSAGATEASGLDEAGEALLERGVVRRHGGADVVPCAVVGVAVRHLNMRRLTAAFGTRIDAARSPEAYACPPTHLSRGPAA